MCDMNFWNKAENIEFQTGPEITGGFSVGFDSKIPENTRDVLMDFIYWAEDHYAFPITLWVDFRYRHYLVKEEGRVGYKFYWAEFKNYPVFHNPDDIPVIELPVRTEKRSMEAVLVSFIEAISRYYAWLMNMPIDAVAMDAVNEILQAYKDYRDAI